MKYLYSLLLACCILSVGFQYVAAESRPVTQAAAPTAVEPPGTSDVLKLDVEGAALGVSADGTPNAPGAPVCTATDCYTLDISWEDYSDDEDGFWIERRFEGMPFEIVQTVGANVTQWCDFVPLPGTCYYYRITAFNSYGTSGSPESYICMPTCVAAGPTYIEDGSSLCGGWHKWGSPYILQGSAEIPEGVSFTIMPEVEVRSETGGNLVVRGTLTADGTIFTSNSPAPQPGEWEGISVEGTATLTGCTVQYATWGINVVDLAEGSVVLETCGFAYNSGAGVSAGDEASVSLQSCSFATNGMGISWSGRWGSLVIRECDFYYDDRASIWISTSFGGLTPIIENNHLSNDPSYHAVDWEGVGVKLYGDVSAIFTGNTVHGFYDGIYMQTFSYGVDPYVYFKIPDLLSFTDNVISGNSRYNLVTPRHPYVQRFCDTWIMNAEGNNWGFSKATAIEKSIWHCKDDDFLTFVDFDPWINPPGTGGCPYVYSWDGADYLVENTILGASGFSGTGSVVTDYLRLSGARVEEGVVKLEVREFERELSSLDEIALLSVDYPSSLSLLLSPEGEPRLYDRVIMPSSVVDQDGQDVLSKTRYADGVIYYGKPGDYLTIEVNSQVESPSVETKSVNGGGRDGIVDIILNAGEKPDPNQEQSIGSEGGAVALESASAATAPDGNALASDGGILVQVSVELSGVQSWKSVARIVPREMLSEILVPGELLGTSLPSTIRLVWEGKHEVDYLSFVERVDSSSGQEPRVSVWPVTLAQHSAGRQVTWPLRNVDRATVDLGNGERIGLEFAVGADVPSDMTRAYVLKTTGSYVTETQGGVEENVPRTYFLRSGSPNPTNPVVEFEYGLPGPSDVKLMVYSVEGRVVRTLVDEKIGAGVYRVLWDGTDAKGNKVTSGVYFCRLQAGDFVAARKMVLLR